MLARLIEVLSGERFDTFLQRRILDRVGMANTAFVVPQDKLGRLTACYKGAGLIDPMKPGLARDDNFPYPGAFVKPVPLLSGGGGLVSSMPDMVALLRSLMPGGPPLLKPDTIALMMANQLPSGTWIQFQQTGTLVGRGYGLAGSVILAPGRFDSPAATGEFNWAGIAGTQWWINPRVQFAGVFLMQREMAFMHPAYFECKRLAYRALGLEEAKDAAARQAA